MTRRGQLLNATSYPDDEVRELWRFALGTLDGEHCGPAHPPAVTRVLRARATALRGNEASGCIRVYLGKPELFPASLRPNRNYLGWVARDWREALVGIVAHEAAHVDQYRRGALSRGGLTVQSRESEADRAAKAALAAYANGGLEKVYARVAELRDAAAAKAKREDERRAYETSAEGKLAKLAAALERWERKARRVARKVASYRRRVHYYERAVAAAKAAKPGKDGTL